jgi:hypothetical protein
MSKVTKMEKIEILIGAAVAASSYNDIMEEKGSADVRAEVMSHFVTVCVMFVADYYTDGDTDKASKFMADGAETSLRICERRAMSKKENASLKEELNEFKITQEELEKALGKEAADKLKALFQGND